MLVVLHYVIWLPAIRTAGARIPRIQNSNINDGLSFARFIRLCESCKPEEHSM